jgi:predicted transposase YbfD/YdcC
MFEVVMSKVSVDKFLFYFREIKDFRHSVKLTYKLDEVFLLALCGTLAGCSNWVEISAYGKKKLEFLRGLLPYKYGTPSHDTLSKIFNNLNPELFAECFILWTKDIACMIEGVIAIDGKTLRGSHDMNDNCAAIHMVSAWSVANNLVLGQVKVKDKSNEITAIPKLLKLLHIEGAIITIDAMGCQKKIAQAIIDGKGDYVLALKGNQGSLHDDIKRFFDEQTGRSFKDIKYDTREEVEKDHGRLESRKIWATSDIPWLLEHHKWAGLITVAMVVYTREINGKIKTDTRYYIASLPANAQLLAECIRSHWHVENKLHWTLDVTFKEDLSRVRIKHGAENYSTIRRLAINLLKLHPAKSSLNVKRLTAGWDDQFMIDIITSTKNIR